MKCYPNFATVAIGGVKDGKTLIPDLATNKKCTALGIATLDLSDNDLKPVTAMKNLNSLVLNNNKRLTKKSLEYLKELPVLSKLLLLNTSITPESTASLASINTLTELGVNGDIWTAKDLRKLSALMPNCKIVADKYFNERQKRDIWDWKNDP